jgi:hypothetical protein
VDLIAGLDAIENRKFCVGHKIKKKRSKITREIERERNNEGQDKED